METDYPALYRESACYDDYIAKVLARGIDEDQAIQMWYELTLKYTS